jgi:hypothetical protein
MSYQAEISRRNPTCFIFLIDQSGSMRDPFGNETSGRSKADFVAGAINEILNELRTVNTSGTEIKRRFYVSVIGYPKHTKSIFSRQGVDIDLAPIDKLDAYAKVEEFTDAKGIKIQKKIWLKSRARGDTPMCAALQKAREVAHNFITGSYGESSEARNGKPEHTDRMDCFPPIVLNITDGEATDGDPSYAARELTQIESRDGNVLLFNLHCSSVRASPISFPDTDLMLPDFYAKQLFYMSSIIPENMIEQARQKRNISLQAGARGFVFNSNMSTVVSFLKIGTTHAV